MIFELPGDEEQMVLHHVEPVQQANVCVGNIGDEEIFIVGKEGIDVIPLLHQAHDPLALQAVYDAHHESDPVLGHDLGARADALQRTATHCVRGPLQDRSPQGAGLKGHVRVKICRKTDAVVLCALIVSVLRLPGAVGGTT